VQSAADIVFLRSLGMAAALGMGVVVRFHGNLAFKATKQNLIFATCFGLLYFDYSIYTCCFQDKFHTLFLFFILTPAKNRDVMNEK
ncbi:MAG: hypothetical protein IJJ60_12475, partial [Clostridia bacterium]|nr:hypothetical protein [Clostridia bacterium]